MNSVNNFFNNMNSKLEPVFNTIEEHLSKWTHLELVSMLTLILLIFHGFVTENFDYPVQLFFLVAVFYRPALSNSFAWGVVAIMASYEVMNFWHHTANHKFLTAYWTWTLCISHWCQSEQHKERNLMISARFLIMLTMAGACIQKLISSSYMDGSFFEITLLTLPSFEFLLQLIGVDASLPDFTKSAMADLRSASTVVAQSAISIPIDATFSLVAMAITVWNLVIQFVLEILCFCRSDRFQLIFHWLFLFFIQTTYIAAPFVGFGFLICIWCYTISAKRFPRMSYLYLASLLMIVVYQSPWRQVLF
ncbi:MAG: hypothetical protein V7765_13275 [Oleispira sp.]